MYDLVPTKEFAMESISCPLTPKSHSLISPREFTRMFDGFTSVKKIKMPQFACNKFMEAFAKHNKQILITDAFDKHLRIKINDKSETI